MRYEGHIVTFGSPFDQALAADGPAAVFLLDREGALRFDATWTRDCWGRAPGPHAPAWTWLLLRHRGTGFVQLILVTSASLLEAHPRHDVRVVASFDEGLRTRDALGHPPIAEAPW